MFLIRKIGFFVICALGIFNQAATAAEEMAQPENLFHQCKQFIFEGDPDRKLEAARDFKTQGDEKNQICLPAALTQRMLYDRDDRAVPFPQLKRTINPYAMVRDFTQLCKTSPKGTWIEKTVACIKEYYRLSEYTAPLVKVIGARPEFNAPFSIAALRDASNKDQGILLQIGWYRLQNGQWEPSGDGGHYVGVYGHEYASSFGEEKIILKVVNTSNDYKGRPLELKYDAVTLQRDAQEPHPRYSEYFLTGKGFDYEHTRGFVESVILFSPEEPLPPKSTPQ